jgi:UDP-N-acetylenolpyruvoylglucosamine reductase
MKIEDAIEKIDEILSDAQDWAGEVRRDADLAALSTIKVGGTAALFLAPASTAALITALRTIRAMGPPYFVLGGGSNVIFPDGRFERVIVSTAKMRGEIFSAEEQGHVLVHADAGCPTDDVVNYCVNRGFGGTESFAGLPGTIGGAVYMNARCYDRQMSDVLVGVEYVGEDMGVHPVAVRNPNAVQQGAPPNNLQDSTLCEIMQMKLRVTEWVSQIPQARGKTRDEIFDRFDNTFFPIAFVPNKYLSAFKGVANSNLVYCGLAYFLDHAVNHHPSIQGDDYAHLQDILTAPDEVIIDRRNEPRTGKERDGLIFVKKYDKNYLVDVRLYENNGSLVFYKSTYLSNKKTLYPKLIRVQGELPVGGSSTIGETAKAAPGGSLSARDTSSISPTMEMSSDFAQNSAIMPIDASEWGYKKSPFQRLAGAIITGAWFAVSALSEGERLEAQKKAEGYRRNRAEKGHFRLPSCGSAFKNNRAFGAPTGKIIDELGLRGCTIGGAQIAPWHGNIIVNTGGATAKDMEELMELVEKRVFEARGFRLEREIVVLSN